jgi:ABC-type antimicrobial peptide transport system permease subunit
MKKQISLQSRLSGIKSIYLVGDEGCDKSFIFDFLELEQEELNHEINIYVKVFENMSSVELYDFPGDKLLRSAMELYLKLLPQPISIVYFIRSDGIEKDLVDWIQIFRKCDVSSKIVFVSDVTTYMEREKILNRIAKEFEINILDVILFVTLEPYSFRRAFDHV